MSIERGCITALRSSGAPCEAALMVNLKLLNDLSHSIFNHKIMDGIPVFFENSFSFLGYSDLHSPEYPN